MLLTAQDVSHSSKLLEIVVDHLNQTKFDVKNHLESTANSTTHSLYIALIDVKNQLESIEDKMMVTSKTAANQLQEHQENVSDLVASHQDNEGICIYYTSLLL